METKPNKWLYRPYYDIYGNIIRYAYTGSNIIRYAYTGSNFETFIIQVS